MRFSLLLASTALAASIGLAACSSGSSQALPGVGGSTTTQAPDNHHGLKFNDRLHLVLMQAKGHVKHDSASCPYTDCFTLPVGSSGEAYLSWCVSTSGNCTSGLLPGEWRWRNVHCLSASDCVFVGSRDYKIKTGLPTTQVQSIFDPRVANPTTQDLPWKAVLHPSPGGTWSVYGEFSACAISGTYKGECSKLTSEGFAFITE